MAMTELEVLSEKYFFANHDSTHCGPVTQYGVMKYGS